MAIHSLSVQKGIPQLHPSPWHPPLLLPTPSPLAQNLVGMAATGMATELALEAVGSFVAEYGCYAVFVLVLKV